MKITLKQWQIIIKPKEELLYNCSEFFQQNDEWVSFPIGMGYTFINYQRNLEKVQMGNHENLVFCTINPDTDKRRRPNPINRSSILHNLSNNGVYNSYVDSNSYFEALPNYKFIISPEGNGIDCHRHYEALMAGCIPIIEDNELIKEKYKGCPILYTKDYSEITKDYLEEKYNEMIDKEYDFSCLLLSSFDDETRRQIKENGNYWSHRLTGKKWYI
jgi:hypothetical protein